jgi:hypothetical protein
MADHDEEEDDEEFQRAVEAHAEYLGMDLDTDSEFLWCVACAAVGLGLLAVAVFEGRVFGTRYNA